MRQRGLQDPDDLAAARAIGDVGFERRDPRPVELAADHQRDRVVAGAGVHCYGRTRSRRATQQHSCDAGRARFTRKTPQRSDRGHVMQPSTTEQLMNDTRSIVTLIALSAIAAGGCATVFKSKQGSISVTSDTPGARIMLNGNPVGSTPANVPVS